LNVLAASSLTESFTALGKAYEATHSDVNVTFDFESSSSLVRKVIDGAPGDVLATADESSMTDAVNAGAIAAGAPVVVARNRLEIVVAPGNPKAITNLADLGRAAITFVLCAPQVPCGRLGALALQKDGVNDAKAASLEENVKAVLTKVVLGEADAGLVYATDVRTAGDKVTGVPITEANDPELRANYPVAVLARSARAGSAQKWVDFVSSTEGQSALAQFGFLPA
jgi:molybdate transport system substrate-binding protein